ncbi:hypothetical protein [Lacipirellula limnantheis]|uniref:Uncharacterized protein n=1 Tax=Lacipirellula limnantheis TaxID=2528024 RepID=A0A517TYE7_9BACT|nr:hypothetical protein [Lacipirellula limnantheis]QDT73375.1 hypothetical protein I41_25640 [Lacipirellula limnantheis]
MSTVIRNALVILCVAVCSLCILLMLTSIDHRHKVFLTLPLVGRIDGMVQQGFAFIEVSPSSTTGLGSTLGLSSQHLHGQPGYFYSSQRGHGIFGRGRNNVFFPLWYVILVFGLLAAFMYHFSGRFTLRSALIAMSVVAGLFGITVML